MNRLSVLRDLVILGLIMLSIVWTGVIVRGAGGSDPLAAFTYESCVACAPPGDLVSFNGNWSISSAPIASYTWDFGDGSPPVKTTSPMTGHLYGGLDSKWQVSLTVQDTAGLSDTVSQLVLFETIPRYTFQPSNPSVGEQVFFNASSSVSYNSTNPIKDYLWSFGDGTSGTGVLATHTYTTAASYRVVLTLLTSFGNPSVSKTLAVGHSQGVTYSVITDKGSYAPGETVHAKLNATNQGTQPVTFTFTDACSGFRFQITDSTGSIIYTNVPPPFAPCAQVITSITIQPGQTVTVATLDWKHVNMQGQQVPAGTYTIIGVIHYQSPYQTTPVASKSITIQAADFQLTISPASTSIAKGSSAILTITAMAQNGFTGTIDFSAITSPTTKHPPILSPISSIVLTSNNSLGTATLTISTTKSTNTGTYIVTITGTSGTTSHSIVATVTITSK